MFIELLIDNNFTEVCKYSKAWQGAVVWWIERLTLVTEAEGSIPGHGEVVVGFQGGRDESGLGLEIT